MTWTAEDERRYQELKRQKEAREAQGQVDAAHSRKQRTASEEAEQEFSFTRMLGGAAQDTYNAVLDTVSWFGNIKDEAFGAVSGGLLDSRISQEERRDLGMSENPLRMDVVGESTNTVESIGRSITGFLIPYAGVAKATKLSQAAPLTTRIARELGAVSIVSMTAMDAQDNNIANTLRDGLGVDNAVIDAIATEEDDDLMVGRIKATIANLPVELAGAAAFEGIVQGFKALRATRKIDQNQKDMIEAVKDDLTVKAFQPKADDAVSPSTTKGKADGSPDAVTPTTDDAALQLDIEDVLKPLTESAEETVTVPKSSVKPKEIRTMQELTDHLKEIVDGVPVGQEAYLEKLAKALVENPHKALDELSIDPVKLDMGVLDSPEKIVALQDSLGQLVEHVARRTGRTGKVVSNVETLRTARMLGQSPMAIARLVMKTKSLPTDLMAARLIVGANAHRLVTSVDAAMKEIAEGVTRGPAWTQFTKDLGQHGLLLGTVRGAGSEIARALQSLRFEVPVKDAGKLGSEAAEEAAESADKFSEAYEAIFKDLSTDAGRLRLLQRLKDANGDITELNKIARSRAKGRLEWVDNAISETKGNLFSLGTSLYNVGSATFMMGFRAISHTLAASGLGAVALVGRNAAYGTAARKQLYKAWANVNAPALAFGRAYRGAWNALKKEGLEELAGIADTLGAEDFAKMVQKSANDADAKVQRDWLKKDMRNGKAIYVSPEAVAKVMKDAEKYPIGRFGQMGLEWLVKTGATGVNLFGAGTRLSLAAFINAPDTFAGTIAAQVGKSTKAVDIAAQEAAEAGLDGKALNDYIKARSIDLEKLVDDGTSANAFDDAAKDLMERAGNDYAREMNFADDLETAPLRYAAALFENMPILGSLIMPFPRTPLRVMERTIIDYTPIGVFKQRVRDAWNTGDPAVRGEIAARYTMATGMMAVAWELAGDRTIVGNDGGWNNTARRERGTYTIKIGGDVHEFSRLDPIGTVLGFMADARAAFENGYDNREAAWAESGYEYAKELGDDIFEAALWPTFKNIFNKAYLDSFATLMDVADARTPEESSDAVARYLSSSATRFVPGSGMQRQAVKLDDGIVRASRGLVDGWVKASIGADKLPPRLDTIFGRPLEYLDGERLIGWKGGPVKANEIDREIARLAFDMRPPRRKQNGVELTQVQYNRLLELRGHEVKLAGKTLEERITSMIEDPRWKRTSDTAKVELIKETITPYTRAAKQALLREDKDFRYRSIKMEVREDFALKGRSVVEADEETRRLGAELGLLPENQ